MKTSRLAVLAAMSVWGGMAMVATPATAGNLERGRALHDTFCVVCHDPSIYSRRDRIANTYVGILQQVERWQSNANLHWSPYDIDSVTEYLAEKYYKLPR
ncbi:MAG: hypothetical protein GC151_15935 [Betaproteobacteria bacterium]|nr:hypothetical protein [Betaproteobacteria bacterium]